MFFLGLPPGGPKRTRETHTLFCVRYCVVGHIFIIAPVVSSQTVVKQREVLKVYHRIICQSSLEPDSQEKAKVVANVTKCHLTLPDLRQLILFPHFISPVISSGRTHSSNCFSVKRPSSSAACLRVVPSACAFLAILPELS